MTETYTGPSDLAISIASHLRTEHKDCTRGGPGACVLGDVLSDDVQEVIDLATGPVVAAELRRIAGTFDDDHAGLDYDTIRWAVDQLRARADELDPPPAVRVDDEPRQD